MAELKRLKELRAGAGLSQAGLHGFTAVAELKPTQNRGRLTRERGLHGFTAVAELKRSSGRVAE